MVTCRPYNTTPRFDRGFTGHEHLYDFGLINMNGRMYDPALSSFLSPDNYMQDPTSQQGFNRYAYCMYNPLKYIDPSGEQYLGWDPSLMNRIEQEAKRFVWQCWQVVYDDISMSHAMTVLMANCLFTQGQQNAGNGNGHHGSPGGGGIQVKDLGDGRYEVVGGSVGPDHSITVINGENAGTVIGYYLTDYSFSDRNGNIVIGATIDLNDHSGQKFWDINTSNIPELDDYMNDILWGDLTHGFWGGYYNFKYKGHTNGDKFLYSYRGMPINFGDGFTYITTARDIGNAYAGFIAEYNGLTQEITRWAFDIYQGSPEPEVSRRAQDYGYDLGMNYLTPRWKEKIFNIYRP